MAQSVQEVLNAISEASQALNREPGYRAEIDSLKGQVEDYAKSLQAREISIVGYKSQIDMLNDKVRSLEVERDDMGFRELETAEKLGDMHKWLKMVMANAEAIMPKSVEVTQAEPVTEAIPVGSAATESTSPPITHSLYQEEPFTPVPPIQAIDEVGQSESPLPPTASTSQDSSPTVTTAQPSEPVLAKPYEGKTHSQVFGDFEHHVYYSDWLAGGGTHYGWQN